MVLSYWYNGLSGTTQQEKACIVLTHITYSACHQYDSRKTPECLLHEACHWHVSQDMLSYTSFHSRDSIHRVLLLSEILVIPLEEEIAFLHSAASVSISGLMVVEKGHPKGRDTSPTPNHRFTGSIPLANTRKTTFRGLQKASWRPTSERIAYHKR